MSSSKFDPQQFKSAQRQGYDSVAQGWKKWWKVIEDGAQVVSDRLVELSKIRQGNHVLDIATGIGEPAITAARKVGPTGKVTAIDISSEMLTIARERAKQNGLSNVIEFQEADAESLRLASSNFDAILSRFGLMFLPNLPNALKVMREALRQNGRVAAAVWSTPDKAPTFVLAHDIVRKETKTPPPPPESPGPFSLADTSILRQKFEDAGFHNIIIESGEVIFKLPSPELYMDFVRSTGAPLTAMMAGLSKTRRDEIWGKIVEAARKYAADRGTDNVTFTNQMIYVSASR